MTAAAATAAGDDLSRLAPDDAAAALAAFARGAAVDGPFRALAAEAARVPRAEARDWIAARFAPGEAAAEPGLLTGYCEPTVAASRRRSDRFATPLHALPPAPLRAASRAAIRAGALAGRGLELFWLEDWVEAFFLEVQGSGRLALAEGGIARVGFAGRNGRPWRSPGRMLVEAGEIAAEAVTAEAVKAWLRADPARGAALLDRCEAVAYFEIRRLAPEEGPIGALGVSVTPGRTVAVDPAVHALGGLLRLEAETRTGPLRRLVAAQDAGGAIRGPNRADLFCGWTAEAAREAGALVGTCRLTPLVPRGAAP